jgi:hypothetical protein
MAQRYRILAYSTTHNQLQQQHDLVNEAIENPQLAQLAAQAYAQKLNSEFFLNSCDWQARTEAYEYLANPGSIDLSPLQQQ